MLLENPVIFILKHFSTFTNYGQLNMLLNQYLKHFLTFPTWFLHLAFLGEGDSLWKSPVMYHIWGEMWCMAEGKIRPVIHCRATLWFYNSPSIYVSWVCFKLEVVAIGTCKINRWCVCVNHRIIDVGFGMVFIDCWVKSPGSLVVYPRYFPCESARWCQLECVCW